MQLPDSKMLYWPALQSWHEVNKLVTASTLLKRPATQLEQEIEPSEDDDFPVVQSMHELDPVVEAYLPSAHTVQDVAVPVTAVYLPFSQLVHDAAASIE